MAREWSPYDEAEQQGLLWTPEALRAALEVWVETRERRTLTVDGNGRLGAWTDLAGKQTLTGDITETFRPNVEDRARTVPKLNVLSSTNQFVTMTPGISYNAANGLCVVGVGELNTARSFASFCGNTAGSCQIRWVTATGKLLSLRQAQAGLLESTAVAVGTGPHVVIAQFATNYCEVGVNGARNTSATNPAFTANMSFIFSRAANDGEAFVGGFYAFIVFSRRLSVNELQRVEGYLAHRYDTTARLVASHPYRHEPPLVGG